MDGTVVSAAVVSKNWVSSLFVLPQSKPVATGLYEKYWVMQRGAVA